MKSQSFLKQILIIGSGTFLNLLLGLLGTPVITRLVNPEQYGQFSMFNTYSSILMLVLGLGLDQSLVRYFYKSEELRFRKRLLFRCVLLPVMACLLAALLLLCIHFCSGNENSDTDAVIILLFCANIFFLLINRFATLTLRLSHDSKRYSTVTVLNKAGYLVSAIVLVRAAGEQNHYVSLAIATTASCGIVTLFAICRQRELWRFRPTELTASGESIKYAELVSYGFPLMIANGVYMFFQAIDRICLEYFCDYTEVGIYSSAMSLMSVIAIVRTTFNTIWTPAAVEHYEKDPDDKAFFQKGNRYITIVMFFIGLTLMFGKDILVMLLGQKYRSAAAIMPFLLFQPIMYTISETTVVGVTLMKKPHANIIIAVIACVVNLLGNILLIPMVGSKGAAISTGFSYIVFFAARTFFSNRYFYIDFQLRKFALMTGITVIFAFYITFVSFNAVTILLYLLAIAVLAILYRSDLLELYGMAKEKLHRAG